MIVVDSNILVRAVLGRRVRQILEKYASPRVRFFAPNVAFADARKYLPIILKKRGKPVDDLSVSVGFLETIIESVEPELYEPFEHEAVRRLHGRDENDWPILATALALRCPVWSEDQDFFGTGVAVWSTSRIEIFLQQRVESRESSDE